MFHLWHLIQALHQKPDEAREDARKNGEDNRSAPRMPAFELRHGDVVVNATRLEHYHQKKRHDEADDAPFQSPKNGLEHLRLDCNRGLFGFKKSACETVDDRRILAEKCYLVLPRSPLPLQGEASVGSFSARHVVKRRSRTS
jgi:hypothetical protein